MLSLRALRLVGGVAAVALAGCAMRLAEPPNLSPHKQQVRAYFEGGRYERDIAAVAAQAQAWIERRSAAGGPRLTVVFDLDETLLSSWPLISRLDFGYVPPEWDRWVNEADAPAIAPVREIYRAARRAGIDVVILTGRPESARESTERNLRAIGCGEYAALIFRPEADKGTTAAFKTAVRRKLTSEGRTIIANIGDQDSDLAGGFAERTFKLPNPLYITE